MPSLHHRFALSQVADQIRPLVEKYEKAFPALLEIPSKDHPYGQSNSPRAATATAVARSVTPAQSWHLLTFPDSPADPSKDSVLKRVKKLFGE